MFSRLYDFAYKRSFLEAIGFYLFFQFASLIAIAILFALLTPFRPHTQILLDYLGVIVGLITTTILGLSILNAKKRLLNIGLLAGLVLSIVLAYSSGAALAYITISFYTMLSIREKK